MSIINNNISVCIDGKRLFSFKSLKLHQPINDHHRFELSLDLEVGGNLHAHNLTDGAKWIGKPFEVRAGEKSETTFVGVVTGVSLHRTEGDFGHILVSGHSETYLLETDLNFHSWNDCTLADIVKEMARNAGVSAKVNPEYKERLDYVCQYNESDFSFIKRLARQYNEWLYYDGFDLVFGRPARLPAAVGLEFGTSLSSLDIGVKALARPSRVFSYHSLYDRTIAEETPNTPTDKDQLGYEAFMASMGMYKQPARQHALPRIHYPSEMTRYVRKKQEADTAESHYVVGRSEHAMLVTGSVVDLKSSFLERAGSVTGASLGEFLITEITHVVGEGSYYGNRFKAIPAVADTLPVPAVELPVAETQMAKVVRNDDKLGHGRVQVQMNWQVGNMHTDWIRVMTPDGGGCRDGVETNRGFVFIPEVGDHVLVGFRHGDPNRPYVMGSLFNGRTGKGGGDGNNCKSICTRSGISIAFDDDSRALTLSDPSGNMVLMDGHGGMRIVAPNDVTLSVGNNLDITVGKNLNLNVGDNQTSVVGNTLSIKALEQMLVETPVMKQLISDFFHTQAGKALLNSHGQIKIEADETNVVGERELMMHSGDHALLNSHGKVEIKAEQAIHELNQADDYETEKENIAEQVCVQFRPNKDYCGEFGFDWFRIGDCERKVPVQTKDNSESKGNSWTKASSETKGNGETNADGKTAGGSRTMFDIRYDTIMGYYHETGFIPDDHAWQRFMWQEYSPLYIIPWKKQNKEKDYVYAPPVMTLLKGRSADLVLNIEVNQKAKELKYEYDKKFFQLDKTTAKVLDKGLHINGDTIRITCIEEFGENKSIEIYAYDEEGNKTLAGKLLVLANDAKHRRRIDVVLVRVRCKITGRPKARPTLPAENSIRMEMLTRFFTQCYVEANIEECVLDLSDEKHIKEFMAYTTIKGNERLLDFKKIEDQSIFDYLVTEMDSYKATSKFRDHYKIFFLNEECYKETGKLYGSARYFNKKEVIVCKDGLDDNTCVHELFHALGLRHPFDKLNKFIFQEFTTDNVMDYSDIGPLKIPIIATWRYQWEYLHKVLRPIEDKNNKTKNK